MTECVEVRARLSEHVDGTLAADERAHVAAHLEACAACRGIAADLERLRAAARQLGPMPPPEHVWLEVAGQIRIGHDADAPDAPPARPRFRAARQWLGLAAALGIVTVGVYWFTRTPPPGQSAGDDSARPGSIDVVAAELTQAMAHYDKAILELERLAKSGDGSLDPEVAATLQKNLTIVDQAIAESRAALASDPESAPARESLFEALRRKVSVLQATVSLMNEMRKGNQQGAAEVMGKKS
jgi:hypothetical protein